MTQEEVSKMLKKPARIKQLYTQNGESFTVDKRLDIVLLQNHNALVIHLDGNGRPDEYTVIASTYVAAVEMEIEEAQPDA